MLMKALKMDNCVFWRVLHDFLLTGDCSLLRLLMELMKLKTPLQGELFFLSCCSWCYLNDEYTYLLWYWWKIKMRIWDWPNKIRLLLKWQIIGMVWLTMCLFRSSVVSWDISCCTWLDQVPHKHTHTLKLDRLTPLVLSQ